MKKWTLVIESVFELFYIDGKFEKKDQTWRTKNGKELEFTPWQNIERMSPTYPLIFNTTVLQ